MKIEFNTDQLKGFSLFVATPMYGGMCSTPYLQSVMELQHICFQIGLPVTFSNISNESLVMRARNYLADEFLRSDCTHLLFIDADIGFKAKDILILLYFNKDIIGAPYSKKGINWNNIKNAIKAYPDIDPSDLSKFAGDYCLNTPKPLNPEEINEVTEIGTGCMMIKQSVFQKIVENYPQLKYKPDHPNTQHFNGSRHIHAFFHCIIDNFHDNILHNMSERYLSEDYTFCQLWKKIGGSIFVCPWMVLHHYGTYNYNCNIPLIYKVYSKLSTFEKSGIKTEV